MTTIIAPVIKRKDHGFPDFLDFRLLRKEGLEHIGQFSGDLWTDHNSHDPGITILETLIYALMDLGYRTQLPIEDLLAQPQDRAEQQFFSPAQILTNNPTTILDYRKMLVDLPGVQNAWLEIDNSEVQLAISTEVDENGVVIAGPELSCIDPDATVTPDPNTTIESIALNGLYKTYIQLDQDYLKNFTAEDQDDAIQTIVDAVRDRLQTHRNLSEDFTDIEVLCTTDVKFCMEVDIYPEADPERTYVEIYEAIEAFFTPEVTFYTLQQMLNKGKSIEEIYEGRPYDLDSYGFVDCDELEAIERIKEIHLSDLYKIIGDIAGVRMVRSLSLEGDYILGNSNITVTVASCKGWVYKLLNDYIPILSANSRLRLKKDGITVNPDEVKIHKLRKQRLVNQTKGRFLENDSLDLSVPQGQYREDLGAYYSIQNDLPAVYGIREGGIPEESSNQRKAQALQLKGYLLFFDQLLAGYLSQLSHLGDVFSMQPDSERPAELQRSFFLEGLDSVPDAHKLIRFYKDKEQNNAPIEILSRPVDRTEWNEIDDPSNPDSIKNLPSASYISETERLVNITRLRKELEAGEYTIEICGQACNYYYIVSTSLDSVVIISKDAYEDEAAAKAAADDMALIASIESNYRLFRSASPNDTEDDADTMNSISSEFAFEVINTHVGYLEILQNLIEKPAEYRTRRSAFLNHLLARFNETFTDFALQLFNEEEKIVDYKAQLVSNYDNLSRNRGRGFNYLEKSWNTDNVSGIERQLAARLGFDNWHRHTLCNFEIAKYDDAFGFSIYAPDGGTLFRSKNNFSSEDKAMTRLENAVQAFHEEKADVESISDTKNSLYTFRVAYPDGYLVSDKRFDDAASRDQYIAYIMSLLSCKPKEDRLKVKSYIHRLELLDGRQKALRQSTQKYTSPANAKKGQDKFISRINEQKNLNGFDQKLALSLVGKDTFLDTNHLNSHFQLKEANYRWQLMGDKNDLLLISAETYTSEVQACDKLLEIIKRFNRRWKLIEVEKQGQSYLQLLDRKRNLIAETNPIDADNVKALKSKIIAVIYREKGSGSTVRIEDKAYNWVVRNEAKEVLLECILWSPTKKQTEHTWREYSDEEFKIVKEEAAWRVILAEKSGYILAQSPLWEAESIAKEQLAEIEILIKDKKNIKYIKHDKAYGFNIYNPKDEEDILLESYHLFPTAAAAVSIVVATAKEVDRKKAYFPIGDEVNLNFGFSIQNDKEHFLAVAPFAVPNEKVRTAALDKSRELLQEYQVPFKFSDEFHFEVQFEEEIVLKSIEAYATPTVAYTAYLELVHGMAQEKNVRKKEDIANQQYFFDVYKENEIIATSGKYSAKGLVESRIAALKNLYHENNYQIQTTAYSASWKFDFHWKDNTGAVVPLFESKKTYASTEAASNAYQYFYKNISTIVILLNKLKKDQYQLAFQHKEEKTPFAVGNEIFKSEEAAKAYQEAVEKLFTYVEDWNKKITTSKSSSHAILQQRVAEEGDHAYRVLDKGLPIAFSPCKCFEKDSDLTPANLQSQYNEFSSIKYCELCLKGDIVIQEGLRYRYVVKAKTEIGQSSEEAQVYFVSTRLYDTIEEAEAAFDNNLFSIIELASNADNYGPNGPIVVPDPNAEEEEEVDPDEFFCGKYCAESSNEIVCVPLDCLDEYNLEDWVECFCSYPVRRCTVLSGNTEDCDPNLSETTQYHFQIVGDCGADVTAEDFPCNKEIIWKSSATYDTAEEAQAAFELFECLLQKETNYRFYLDDDGVLQERAAYCCFNNNTEEESTTADGEGNESTSTDGESCCYYLAITEVLIESACFYSSKEVAWGQDLPLAFLEFEGSTFLSVSKACSLLGHTPNPSDSTPNKVNECLGFLDLTAEADIVEEGGMYGFVYTSTEIITDENGVETPSCYAKSPIIYESAAAAEAAATIFKNRVLANNRSNSICRVYRDNNCYYQIGVREEDECPKIPCKDIFEPSQYLSGQGILNKDNCLAATHRKRGLEEFLELSCNDDTFYPIADFSNIGTASVNDAKPYSFLAVNDAFRLAKHPFIYNTALDRDQAILKMCENCFDENGNKTVTEAKIVENSPNLIIELGRVKNSSIKSNTVSNAIEAISNSTSLNRKKSEIKNETNISTAPSLLLKSENIPFSAHDKQIAHVMKYASDARFYKQEGEKLYILNNKVAEFGVPIANSQRTIAIVITNDKPTENKIQKRNRFINSIENTTELAINYPYRMKGDQFTFQYYCDTFEPNVPYLTDDVPCVLCPEEGAEVETETGAVIWESCVCYDTKAEVECQFELFCTLVSDKDNYQAANVLDCDSFQIILTNPKGVIAHHPQWYSKSADVERAIQKTQLYSQTQGLQLIEHILLRPRDKAQAETENCLLPIHPDDCELCCVPLDPDPCAVQKALDALLASTDDSGNPSDGGGSGNAGTEENSLCLAEKQQIGRYAPKTHQFNCEEEEYCEKYRPGADPYSFVASIALPNWTKKYNTIEGREAIQNMLREQVPAHVLLNILWLRPKDMCKLEDEYRKWLLWLRCADTCGTYDPCSLVNCLMQAQSCALVVDEVIDLDCQADKTGAEINISNLLINSMFLNDDDHLHTFENLEGALEYTGNIGYFLEEIQIPPPPLPEEEEEDNGGVVSVITLATSSEYGNSSNFNTIGFESNNNPESETTESTGGSGGTSEETTGGTGGSGGTSEETTGGTGGSGGTSEETIGGSGGSGGTSEETIGGSGGTSEETTGGTGGSGDLNNDSSTIEINALKTTPKEQSVPKVTTPRTIEEERNIQRLLSTRTEEYNKQLEAITNKNINQSEYYHRTAFFLRNNSDLDSYVQLLQFFIDKNNESTRKTGLKNYTKLLKISTHYLLDRLVAQDPSNLQAADQLIDIWQALEATQVEVATFADDWNEAALVENLEASVTTEYIELLKLIA